MAATWQELLAYFNGSLIGGEVVVRVNKKHVSVGKMRNGVFAWTPAGLELAATAVIPRGIPAASRLPVKNKGGRPRKVQENPDGGLKD